MSSELTEELQRIRGLRGLSLRQVEKQTGISNTYLSQLETGKAERPSPHILHKLAAVYKVPYESLMQAAGYLEPQSQKNKGMSSLRAVLLGANLDEEEEENLKPPPPLKSKRLTGLQAALLSANLNEEEEKKVVEFIEFLRSQNRRRKR